MFPMVRVGDANSAGGIATLGNPTVRINGRPVALAGGPVTPHPCCGAKGCGIHCVATTTGSSLTVKVMGVPVAVGGSIDTCGHARATGSSSVRCL